MKSIDEGRRAVEELQEKELTCRRLVVSVAKAEPHQPR